MNKAEADSEIGSKLLENRKKFENVGILDVVKGIGKIVNGNSLIDYRFSDENEKISLVEFKNKSYPRSLHIEFGFDEETDKPIMTFKARSMNTYEVTDIDISGANQCLEKALFLEGNNSTSVFSNNYTESISQDEFLAREVNQF